MFLRQPAGGLGYRGVEVEDTSACLSNWPQREDRAEVGSCSGDRSIGLRGCLRPVYQGARVCACVCTRVNGTYRPLFLHTYLRRRFSADLNTWNAPLTVTSTFTRQQCREADSSPWGSSIRGAPHHPELFPAPPPPCQQAQTGAQQSERGARH